jgi:hypothetical protein
VVALDRAALLAHLTMETNRSNVRGLDEDVRAFFVAHYSENPANPTGVPLYNIKRAVPGFRKALYKDVKRYFREHPDYWMAGQRVLPTTLAASMGTVRGNFATYRSFGCASGSCGALLDRLHTCCVSYLTSVL